MSSSKFYTRDEIEHARKTLSNLPDLAENKITSLDALAALKDQIVELACLKRYSAAEIKSALESVGVSLSERAIRDVIREGKESKHKRKTNKKVTSQ